MILRNLDRSYRGRIAANLCASTCVGLAVFLYVGLQQLHYMGLRMSGVSVALQAGLAAGLVFSMCAYYFHYGLLQSLLRYLADHPSQAVILILFYLLCYGLIGSGLGIANLFWADTPLTRLSSSWAATLLLGLLGVNAYYLIPAGRQDETIRDLDHFIEAHAINLAFGGWLEPQQGQPLEVSRLLRAARLPFLTLLVLPAALPAAFPFANWFAPIYGYRGEKLLDIDPSVRGHAGAWAVSLGVWLAGILLGVLTVKLLNLFSSWLAPRAAAGGLPAAPGAAGLAGRIRRAYEWTTRPSAWAAISHEKQLSLVRFAWVVAAVYLLLAAPGVYDRVVSASVAICAALGLIAIGSLAFALFVSPRLRIPAAAAIVVIVALFGGDNKLRFEGMDYDHEPDLRSEISDNYLRNFDKVADPRPVALQPAQPGGPSPGTRVRDWEALCRWEGFVRGIPDDRVACQDPDAEPPPGPDKPRLAVVCVTGGASRSAYWSARALERIERRIPDFHRYVRVIAGASGGMVGTAYYVKTIKAGGRVARKPGEQADWVDDIPVDSLKQVARHIALRSLWYGLSNPWRRQPYDRGIELEETWEDLRGITFAGLYPLEAAGRIPSLIFSPMTVEDGRRLLITNLDLARPPSRREAEARVLALNEGSLIDPLRGAPDTRPYSLSAIEFAKSYPRPGDLRLSTAVRMSASFPWVSPAVNLPGTPRLRVVDAGYYDNYGVSVAVSWLYQNREWLMAHASGVILVQIRDSLSFDDRFDYAYTDSSISPMSIIGAGLQFFHSPIDAVVKARETSAIFRNDQEIALLGKLFEGKMGGRKDFFTTAIFENAAEMTPTEEPSHPWPGDGLVNDGSSRELESRVDRALEARLAAEAGLDVEMSWNLTVAERRSLDEAIPQHDAGWSGAANAARRRERIKALRLLVTGDVEVTRGSQRGKRRDLMRKEWLRRRPYALQQYARALNYERLETLADWWSRG